MLKSIKFLTHKLLAIPAKLHIKRYELLYPFYKNQFIPTKAQQKYRLNATQIYGQRTPGVSGYYRLYNEADFLVASVESHLAFFDEIILLNDCTTTDKTPAIAQTLAKKYPDKIKYFYYAPEAYKLRSKAYKILPYNHPNSFANYYNFALSKTSHQIVTKIDGDHIAIDSAFAKITKNSHDSDFMKNIFYTFTGINLWLNDGELLVDTHNQHIGGDHGFYTMRQEKHYYTKAKTTEDGYFSVKNRQIKNAGILYFHLKNMRSSISNHSYRGLDDASHQKKFAQRLKTVQQTWLNWADFVTQYRQRLLLKTGTDIAELPDPNIYLKNKGAV